jgi:hypothetical protein
MGVSQLPNGKQQFIDSNGAPLVGGTVGMYVPATLTPKSTWQDIGQSVLNQNPLTLDARGQALIYGSGTYRQIVKDVLGNLIWDVTTTSSNLYSYAVPSSVSLSSQPVLWWITPEMFGAVGDGVTDDTGAMLAWMSFLVSAVSGTGSAAGRLGTNKTYLMSQPLPFNASIYGDGSSSSVIKASASFVGSQLLDMNNSLGTFGQNLCGFALDVRPLGAGGTAKCIGSSSTYGGGGAAIGDSDDIFLLSSSTSTHAMKLSSSGLEIGALTGRTFRNMQVAAPLLIYAGNNQDQVLFENLRLSQTAGGTAAPVIMEGTNQKILTGYMAAANLNAANVDSGLVQIDNNNVLSDFMFETVASTNATFAIIIPSGGSPTITNLETNMAYGGAVSYAALVSITSPITAIRGIGPTFNGYRLSSGSLPYGTGFCFDSTVAANAAVGPTCLTVTGEGWKHWDSVAANFSIAKTGSTPNTSNIWQINRSFGGITGVWQAPHPAAGSALTWSPVPQPATWQ